MLYDIFVESNQPLPLPPTGVNLVSAELSPEQLAVLFGLPPANPIVICWSPRMQRRGRGWPAL